MRELQTAAVLGYPRCGEQDTLVVWEILKSVSWLLDSQYQRKFTVTLLATEGGHITMQMGAEVVPEGILGDGDLYDLFYVPGGLGSGDAIKSHKIRDAIRRHHRAGRLVASNCTGCGILHRAGILGDVPVTAAPTISRRLREEGTKVVNPRRMWLGVPEANLWTTAGGSGVHASTVALVCHYFGREIGKKIAMMWDTMPRLGESALFHLEGPEYYTYPEGERDVQRQFEDQLLPRL
jgi:transcriptional regulator GlxA family with amidase domain